MKKRISNIKSISSILLSLCLLLLLSCCTTKEEAPKQRYVVVVSIDGFRWDYSSLYSTPCLDSIAEAGVSSTLIPSYPASTFPNHWTLATGLYPDNHGIISNNFWDELSESYYKMRDSTSFDNPYYYGGEPLWVTASNQGLRAAVVYWVGLGAVSNDSVPFYKAKWKMNNRMSLDKRVDYLLDLMNKPEKTRPHLLMLYMEQPDAAGHSFGPKCEETGTVVHYVDSLIGKLRRGINSLPYASQVDLIVLSDHGMTDVAPNRILALSDYVKPEWIKRAVGHTPTNIFSADSCHDSILDALRKVKHIQVWEKDKIPAKLHYGTNSRIGDIIVAPELGWLFSETPINWEKVGSVKGEHGYYPWYPDMQTIFCGVGPDFKKSHRARPFENVCIYPLVCHLLGIEPAANDGNIHAVNNMLKVK